MNNSAKLYDLFWTILQQLPSLITILGCLIFTAVRWKRAPRVAMIVAISLVLLLFHGPLFAVIYEWVPDLFTDRSTTAGPSYARPLFLGLGLIYHAALAIPFVLLLIGIF